MSLNPQYILSQSFANSASLQLPSAPNLQTNNSSIGGSNMFDVGQYDAYSFQVFLTGSNVNGTLYHRISNNCATFVPYQSQSFNAANLSQDTFFGVLTNISQYAQLYWSGSGSGQLTASVSLYGKRGSNR